MRRTRLVAQASQCVTGGLLRLAGHPESIPCRINTLLFDITSLLLDTLDIFVVLFAKRRGFPDVRSVEEPPRAALLRRGVAGKELVAVLIQLSRATRIRIADAAVSAVFVDIGIIVSNGPAVVVRALSTVAIVRIAIPAGDICVGRAPGGRAHEAGRRQRRDGGSYGWYLLCFLFEEVHGEWCTYTEVVGVKKESCFD